MGMVVPCAANVEVRVGIHPLPHQAPQQIDAEYHQNDADQRFQAMCGRLGYGGTEQQHRTAKSQ